LLDASGCSGSGACQGAGTTAMRAQSKELAEATQ
jgi:hypothetical protein